MERIPVENELSLERDPYSKAIINTNVQAYEDYMASYEKRKINRENVDQLRSDVDSLKSDISDIKSLLTQFLEKTNDN